MGREHISGGGGIGQRTRRRVGSGLRRLASTKLGLAVLGIVLKDDVLFRATRILSDRNAANASFDAQMPGELTEATGFEDVWWLFDQSEMSHGLSRLRIGEAAYLWKLARSRPGEAIAEIGRYRGGTAFLLAAAGARVVTLDNDAARQAADIPQLERALDRVGLRDRVEIHVADARSFPVEPESFSAIVLDAVWPRDALEAVFTRWWDALRVGGDLVLRSIEPRDPGSEHVIDLCRRLRDRNDAQYVTTFWQWAHFRRIDGGHGRRRSTA